jgi:hypothetical protein
MLLQTMVYRSVSTSGGAQLTLRLNTRQQHSIVAHNSQALHDVHAPRSTPRASPAHLLLVHSNAQCCKLADVLCSRLGAVVRDKQQSLVEGAEVLQGLRCMGRRGVYEGGLGAGGSAGLPGRTSTAPGTTLEPVHKTPSQSNISVWSLSTSAAAAAGCSVWCGVAAGAGAVVLLLAVLLHTVMRAH